MKSLRIVIWTFVLTLPIFMWNCLDESKRYRLDLTVGDSLDVAQGKVDSIRISITNANGDTVYRIFSGPYSRQRDAAALADFDLGSSPPDPMTVYIFGYRSGRQVLEIRIAIRGNRADAPVTVSWLPPDVLPPVFRINGYASGQSIPLTDSNAVRLAGSIWDSGSGLRSFGYAISGRTTRAYTPMPLDSAWDLGGMRFANGGESIVHFVFEDSSGNIDSATLRIYVNVPLPTVVFVPPTPQNGWVGVQDRHTVQWTVNSLITYSEIVTLNINETKVIEKTAINTAQDTARDTLRISRVPQYVRFVNPIAAGRKSGDSWQDAYTDLFGFAGSGSIYYREVWVSKGNYQPPYFLDSTGKKAIPVTITDSTHFYGGFEGTESRLSDRKINQSSIIDGNGELDSNLIELGASSVFDGFTVTGGKNRTLVVSGGPKIQNCLFSNNGIYGEEWAVVDYRGTNLLTITNSSFIMNNTTAVILNNFGNINLSGCTFQGNRVSGHSLSDGFPDMYSGAGPFICQNCTADTTKSRNVIFTP